MIIQSHSQLENSHEFVDAQLLTAGSKISAMDLYRQQLDIPIVKGKYYKVDDVQNVFILMNGVLDDIAQHASRTSKQIDEFRQEVSILKEDLSNVTEINTALTNENVQLKDHINHLLSSSVDYEDVKLLQDNLRISEENYSNLLESASTKLKESQEIERKNERLEKKIEELNFQISQLQNENENLKSNQLSSQSMLDLEELLDVANDTIDTQRHQLDEQSQIIDSQSESIRHLTYENNVLNYKVDTLRTINHQKFSSVSK